MIIKIKQKERLVAAELTVSCKYKSKYKNFNKKNTRFIAYS